MARKPTPVGPDKNAFAFGKEVLVERGLAGNRNEVPKWVVYHKVDVSKDDNTSLDWRWDEVDAYEETEVGVMPDKAMAKAVSLAEKGVN